MCKQFFILLAFLLSSFACAETAPRPFVLNNNQVLPIHSKITGRDHELVVVLPSSYASNPDKKYPVLYYLDAYWDTPLLVSTYGNLVYDNVVPEFIMVGLSYPSSASYDKERRIDYTITAAGENSGKANLFLSFIQNEVAPLVESKFRGLATDRVLSGNSLGGLFTVAAAYKCRNSFPGLSQLVRQPVGIMVRSLS